jgi:hypothetical protein
MTTGKDDNNGKEDNSEDHSNKTAMTARMKDDQRGR